MLYVVSDVVPHSACSDMSRRCVFVEAELVSSLYRVDRLQA